MGEDRRRRRRVKASTQARGEAGEKGKEIFIALCTRLQRKTKLAPVCNVPS